MPASIVNNMYEPLHALLHNPIISTDVFSYDYLSVLLHRSENVFTRPPRAVAMFNCYCICFVSKFIFDKVNLLKYSDNVPTLNPLYEVFLK